MEENIGFMIDENTILTSNDLMTILGIKDKRALLKYIKVHNLPSHKLPNGMRRFIGAELIEWILNFDP